MFDNLFGAVGGNKQKQAEITLQLLGKLLSPSQRALITILPAMANQVVDMSKKPLPKILMDRRANRVVIVYEFATEQDAILYHTIEEKTMQIVKDFKAELEKAAAAQQEQKEQAQNADSSKQEKM